jgi:hypothetical protein
MSFNLPPSFLRWETWAHGLIAAFIGGASSSLIDGLSRMIENQRIDWHELLRVALIAGLLTALAYLKQSPLPPSEPK